MKIVRIGAIWCPSCLIMRPLFEKVEAMFPQVTSLVYDIDLDEEASDYNVGSILPVFILLDENNSEISRLIGEQKKEVLVKMIEDHL